MSLLGRIFGSNKIIDGIADTVDKAWYTDQEKAEAHRKLLQTYEAFKLAQRLLSLTFALPYCLAWFLTFGAIFLGFDVSDDARAMLDGRMADIIAAIVGFYFFGGALSGVLERNKK